GTTTTTLCTGAGCPSTTSTSSSTSTSTSLTLPTTTTLAVKIVFVTSATHTGNLGGLSGADAICNTDAAAGGLPGTYMAWLSDGSVGPSTRFTHALVPYVLPSGTVLANDWTDLTDGNLANPIRETANLLGVHDSVWTATFTDGTNHGSGDCVHWT